ncbi:MAG: hypothetical protein ABIS25_08145 [Sphingomicrobium sp.]
MLVRLGGQDLAVEGGRAWHLSIPLAAARAWLTSSGYSLPLTLVDMQLGTETRQVVILPPGALGRKVELATLIVRAR